MNNRQNGIRQRLVCRLDCVDVSFLPFKESLQTASEKNKQSNTTRKPVSNKRSVGPISSSKWPFSFGFFLSFLSSPFIYYHYTRNVMIVIIFLRMSNE